MNSLHVDEVSFILKYDEAEWTSREICLNVLEKASLYISGGGKEFVRIEG
jgi:hypothetical protein